MSILWYEIVLFSNCRHDCDIFVYSPLSVEQTDDEDDESASAAAVSRFELNSVAANTRRNSAGV